MGPEGCWELFERRDLASVQCRLVLESTGNTITKTHIEFFGTVALCALEPVFHEM